MRHRKLIEKLNTVISIVLLIFFIFIVYSGYKFANTYNFDFFKTLTSNKVKMLSIASILGLFSLVWGLCCFIYRKRNFVSNINVAILSTVIISPILGEIVLRVGIHANISFFRNPELYADAYSDDDYWKLSAMWEMISNRNTDPLLGWSIPKTLENPLGIHKEKEYIPNFRGNVILFFGDSFVAKQREIPSVPFILDNLLPFYDVYNYGVNGYGLDQIYLRFQQEYHQFSHPIILFGILTLDLDRSLLTIRSAVKPRFIDQAGQLLLTNVPIASTSVKAWVQEHPPQIKSYYFSLLSRCIDLFIARFDDKIVNHREDEKKMISRYILRKIYEEAKKNYYTVIVVIFYSPLEIYTMGWRERFLKETLNQLNLPYIDTKEFIAHDVAQNGNKISSYYDKTDHHSTMGNQVIAHGIAQYLHNNYQLVLQRP